MSAVMAEGLTRHFGKIVAVDQVDLRVKEATIFGFLGPNGSGKTTMIRMLCGLLRPTAGKISVLGLQIPKQAELLKSQLGYMTQRFSLYDDLSVLENLTFMTEIHGIAASSRRQRVAELLQEYRLDALSGRRASTLSGGQKQRLALAAATIHRPKLLFLDEPTSAVDPQSRRDFWEGLFDLVNQGTTVLVSTHYMDEAERCHQLAILDHGKLVANGSPAQLQDDVDATVIELSGQHAANAKQAVLKLPALKSSTQLGTQIRLLIDDQPQAALASVEQLIGPLGSGVSAAVVSPNLEDVFVVATQLRRAS